MQGTLKDWKETRLYQQIQARASASEKQDSVCVAAQQALDLVMPDIQAVLQQGGTAATDFTLHDAQHGFRVAERMAEIADGLLGSLSGYELALLLLSAYLHDIGMTPEKCRVTDLYRYLLTREKSNLDLGAIERFQHWLDVHGGDATLPLAQQGLTGKTLDEAEWLITHYCRERHNDWSGEWIATYFTDKKFGHYTEWAHDLIALCKSHHYGFEELVGPRFNPVEVGSTVVHLRYLAAVLRLADVMEIDPERTLEVVLRQRDVDPSSLIYWSKDHGISLKRDGKNYRLAARPRSALFHKAVADTANQIEQELLVCRRLADETDFGFLPGSSTRLPHRWDLSAALVKRIEPFNNAYEYIDGTFRPDVRRLLKLLSGIELYGNELAAVRELLQNAFDAVRERIARERLANPTDPNRAELLGRLYQVILGLEQQGDAYWLVCRDQGAGMSKGIIRDHLLVSGASRRDDLLRLQRQCEEAGFRLERTARFGIGVLSYFMIADEVHIRTRRCQSATHGEDTGWSFVTDSLNGFGELKRDPDFIEGTEVRLRVKRTLIGNDPAILWQRIVAYVREALTHIPCQLHVSCTQFPESNWSVGASGWVRDPAVYAEQSLSVLTPNLQPPTQFANLADHLGDLVPGERFSTWRRAKDRSQTLHDMAHRCLRWSEPVVGNLPDGLGRYRFFFPWFELEGGPCLHFFEIEEIGGTMVAQASSRSDNIAWAPWCPGIFSWFGVSTDHKLEQLERYRSPGVIEIDWTSEAAGKIEVSRNRIILSEKAEQVIEEVVVSLKKAIQVFAEQHTQSYFALYNCALTDGKPPSPERWHWLCQHERKPRLEWRQLRFPVVAPFYRDDSKLMRNDSYRWRDQDIPRFCGISGSARLCYDLSTESDSVFARRYSDYGMNETWYSPRLVPDRVVLIRSETPWGLSETHHFGMLWECAPIDQDPRVVYPEAQFPPEWASLCLFMDPPHVIWNRDHRLVRAASRHGWKALMAGPCKGGDPRPFASELSSDSELAAAWLLFCLSNGLRDLVKGVAEHSPDLIQGIWQRAFGAEPPDRVWAHIADGNGHRLVSISPRGWDDYENNRENAAIYKERLAVPDDDWCVYSIHQENSDT
ncbi:MAG: hypothetical protein ABTR54_09465 [Candidatus Competibacter sp.]